MVTAMQRRTKIVATIGPASERPATLRAMVAAGMNTARLSLAHGPLEETLARIEVVRGVAAEEGATIGILADLPGPKVRAARFADGASLASGDEVDLVPAGPDDTSDGRRIAVDQPGLLAELQAGDRVALGDGGTELCVEKVLGDRAATRVLTGGVLKGSPGVALPTRRVALKTPTPDDLRLLAAVCEAGVDAVAVSFVRSAADIDEVRAAAGPDAPMLVAKIETQEAVDDLDHIIPASDGVMVARGDLGIRCALEDVPHYQKLIIRTGVAYGRPVITATQMLESMVSAPAPTRAEVSDVANAVFDGSSALLLSGETAVGHDPVGAVTTMARVATRAEREFDYMTWGRNLGRQQFAETRGAPAEIRITAAISAAAWRAASEAEAAAIVVCTSSGAGARAISRFRPTMPILAVTPSERTARQLSVAWGITPVVVPLQKTADDMVWFAIEAVVALGMVKTGDVVAVLVGTPADPQPTTDVLRLIRIR
jgi:pyruvate kinase